MSQSSYNEKHVVLRTALDLDLAAARALLAALDLPVDGLEDHFHGGGYVVALAEDGVVVGLGGVEVYGSHGLLRSVGVRVDRQGTSIGRAIAADRIAWARARGLAALYLLTETAPGFFERLGFRRIPRGDFPPEVQASSEFAHVCPESAVAMRLALD